MNDWGKNRNWMRYSRKKRHWGRHGHDHIRWSVNQAFRTIAGHYYYRMSDYYPDAERKWRLNSAKGWGK